MKYYRWGARSLERLSSCHPLIIKVFDGILKDSPFDMTIIEGHRSRERQQKLFEEGLSTLHGQHPKARHCMFPSEAIDVAPYIKLPTGDMGIPWNETGIWYDMRKIVLARCAEVDVELRWGGDWDRDGDFTDQRFNDFPHWELVRTNV